MIPAKLRAIYGPLRSLDQYLDELIDRLDDMAPGDMRRPALEARIVDVERELLARAPL